MDEDDTVGEVGNERFDSDVSGRYLVIEPAGISLVGLSKYNSGMNKPFCEGLLLDIDPLLLQQYHGCMSDSGQVGTILEKWMRMVC